VYPTRENAPIDISGYIELLYNQNRLHSALGYMTPNEAERNWFQQTRQHRTQQIHCPETVGLLIDVLWALMRDHRTQGPGKVAC